MKYGLVGYGYWGKIIFNTLNKLVDDDIIIYDANNSSYSKNISDVYDNCDHVFVATPLSTHFQTVELLLNNYCNVFCEKPLTSDINQNKYLVKKVKEDAQVYAETIFLQRMTRKNFLTQLKQVDNGDSSARMHEVVNQSISQIRDNIKFAQSQRTDLEKYYRDMRKDYDRMMENIKQTKIEQGIETKADGKIVDARSLNDMIDKMIKNRD